MSDKIIKTATALKGQVEVPGDKSISHRSIMFGALANGTTEVTHFLKGADCLSTIDCFRKMGITIEETEEKILVHGKGIYGLKEPSEILNVGNSGTTTRLISGILSGQDFPVTLSGDDSLNSRPMQRIIKPLTEMGANIKSVKDNGCAPLSITPGKLHGIHYMSPVASAQVKSAILLAGLYADSPTMVTEPSLSRNHTELMLSGFGATVSSQVNEGGFATARIEPCKELFAQKIEVPGDISSAAYFIAAGLLVPGSEILVKNVGTNPTRAGFIKVCQDMGADITLLNESIQSGESRADVLVKYSSLHGTTVAGSIIPTLIDEIPMIAVMAAFAEGKTIIKDAAELKVKESNRIDTVVTNLKAMGCDITPTEDGMIIQGGTTLHGAKIESYLDHRIAMSFAIGALAAQGESIIHNSDCVDISYPDFYQTLDNLR